MRFSIIKPSTTCKECGKTFSSLRGLNSHLRACLKPELYYHKHYPKRDPLSLREIPFKNTKQYFADFFESGANERKWVRNNPEGSLEWYRFKIDNILKSSTHKYCYSWVEWVSRGGIPFTKDIIRIIKETNGLLQRFFYDAVEIHAPVSEDIILVDSREQKPLFEKEKTKINFGDYTLSGSFYNKIHIDRKSLSDFISTLTAGKDRFEREIEGAAKLGCYLVVLVEEDFYTCLSYKPKRFTKQVVTGRNAFYNVRQLMQKYKNIQFLFVDGRENAKLSVRTLLANPDLVNNYDLQYVLESGIPLFTS